MQLIDRACQILTILSYQPEGMSVLELSEKINLAPSTTHRILTSLKENKWLFRIRTARNIGSVIKSCLYVRI